MVEQVNEDQNQATRIVCSRRIEWDSAHRVMRHESKCATLHGHRYVAEIVCEADALDTLGRVVDFGVVKRIIGGWVDANWDHTTLANRDDVDLLGFCYAQARDNETQRKPYEMPGEPTAENIAVELLTVAERLIPPDGGLHVVSIRIWETPNCWAEAFA